VKVRFWVEPDRKGGSGQILRKKRRPVRGQGLREDFRNETQRDAGGKRGLRALLRKRKALQLQRKRNLEREQAALRPEFETARAAKEASDGMRKKKLNNQASFLAAHTASARLGREEQMSSVVVLPENRSRQKRERRERARYRVQLASQGETRFSNRRTCRSYPIKEKPGREQIATMS